MAYSEGWVPSATLNYSVTVDQPIISPQDRQVTPQVSAVSLLGIFPRPDACGSVEEWSGHWTCEQQVSGSNPGHCIIKFNSAEVVNTHLLVIEQYNLVPANEQRCLVAGEYNHRSSAALAASHRH